ncbi:hypothetical protein D3C74_372440 [compost metagenome]
MKNNHLFLLYQIDAVTGLKQQRLSLIHGDQLFNRVLGMYRICQGFNFRQLSFDSIFDLVPRVVCDLLSFQLAVWFTNDANTFMTRQSYVSAAR